MPDRHGRVPMPAVLEPPEGLIDEEQRIRYIQRLRPQPLRSFTDPVRLTGAADALRSAFIRTRVAPPGDPIAAVAAQPALADGRIESWLLPTTRSFLTRTAPWTCSTTSRRPCESGVRRCSYAGRAAHSRLREEQQSGGVRPMRREWARRLLLVHSGVCRYACETLAAARSERVGLHEVLGHLLKYDQMSCATNSAPRTGGG
jgi:hypothetical protein